MTKLTNPNHDQRHNTIICSLRSKHFRTYEDFFDFWPCENWGSKIKSLRMLLVCVETLATQATSSDAWWLFTWLWRWLPLRQSKWSVTNNSLSKDYPHPDDHTRQTTTQGNQLLILGSNHLPKIIIIYIILYIIIIIMYLSSPKYVVKCVSQMQVTVEF